MYPHLTLFLTQGRPQAHVFVYKVLSHTVNPCLCLSASVYCSFSHSRNNIHVRLLLVISCLPFSPHGTCPKHVRFVSLLLLIHSFIHSFIPDIYIAPLQETYSEVLRS